MEHATATPQILREIGTSLLMVDVMAYQERRVLERLHVRGHAGGDRAHKVQDHMEGSKLGAERLIVSV